MKGIKYAEDKDKNAFKSLIYKYSPYWPLFTILLIIFGGVAFAYLKFMAKPEYSVGATILVVDQKKGVDESKILKALNISENTIVDNEIEVLYSNEFLKVVVDSLQLYAPVFEEGLLVSYAAYATSPVIIKAKNPNQIIKTDKVSFSYDSKNKKVLIAGQSYPLKKWVKTSNGILKFLQNPHLVDSTDRPLYFSLLNPKEVLNDLSTRINISAASKLSSVINLKIKDEVPQRGEDILNTLIQVYYSNTLNDKKVLVSNTLSFIQDRIANVSSELDSIEKKIKDLKTNKGIIDLSEQGRLYLANVSDNDSRMTNINMQLAMLNEVEKYVSSNDNKIGIVPSLSAIGEQKFLSQLLEKLYTDQMQYERLKKTIPAGNPAMFSLKTEIDNMRPTILENIQNERISLNASKNNLSSSTGSYISKLQSIPQKEKDLLEINRQQAIKNDAYSFLLQKREEMALSYAGIVSNSHTINNATASYSPVSPKKTFVYSSALAMALLLGFVFVNLKEKFTNKVLFRSDIEKMTDIPVVAEVLNIKEKQPLTLVNSKNHLIYVEQFMQLRAAIGITRNIKYKKILVTSGSPSEGKSFISNNLALSLAQSGRKVVLLDFDIRRAQTSRQYNLENNKGLGEYLENSDILISEIIYPISNNSNLKVIPAGSTNINSTELLLTKDLFNLFSYLESQFDFIIVDTCPLDPFIDASIISEYCDVSLLVIRHGHTKMSTLESLNRSHKITSMKNLFIVFNGIKSRGFLQRGYGHGFGYGLNNIYAEKVYQISKTAGKA
jgi:tyrosine-protein kinase Etk/Wzc